MTAPVAIVSGMVAGDAGQGGATWAVLQYVLGLERLGWQVALVEPVTGRAEIPLGCTVSARYFDDHVRGWLTGPAALVRAATGEWHGLDRESTHALARRARLLVNVSGMLRLDPPFDRIPVRAYLDLDPVFNQLWHHAHGIDRHFAGHTHHVTVGTRVGREGCSVPMCGLEWLPTLPPVVLRHWPVAGAMTRDAFTTVGHWRSYGSVEHDGVVYGQRAHSTRQLLSLPLCSVKPVAMALGIDQGETADLDALSRHGWVLLDPGVVARDPRHYREFVQGSFAELGVAKAGYVTARCGWFSDRSACYLASGRPVLAQDTGLGDTLPVGEGLLTFSTVDDAIAAIEQIVARYAKHRAAARRLAEEHLASDRVLGSLLTRMDAA